LHKKSLTPAPKARNIKARGKREAQRNASPLVTNNNFEESTESAKYQPQLFRSFRASPPLFSLPGATRLTLFGACPWLSYFAPVALAVGTFSAKPRKKRKDAKRSYPLANPFALCALA
jgi:hypothetical protein